MARVKNLFFSDVKNFSPKNLEEILSVVRKLEKLPPIKPFDKRDRRKISGRSVKYITNNIRTNGKCMKFQTIVNILSI